MATPAPRSAVALSSPSHHAHLARFAWPAAFVAVAALGYAAVHDLRPVPPSEVKIVHPTPTVLKDLRALARLETESLHVEKVVDVSDHQSRLYGLVDAEDALVFVATGDVILGVDLGKLRDGDATFEEANRTAYINLPALEILSSHVDEAHSYVHARTTDVLAKRNESLESVARRDALAAFEATAREPSAQARAKESAEKQIGALAKAWGATNVVVTWSQTTPRGGPQAEIAESP